jgi:hypothetical protein
MPRGARQPGPGTNRTDLASPTPAPIQTAPGQTYGEAGAQQAAQQAVPTANGPTAVPGGAPQVGMDQIMAQATANNGPGNSMLLNRPTERPNEPVTAGLPVGPGAGPESLQGVGAVARDNAVQQGTLAHLLTSIAQAPGATDALRDLASRAQAGNA